MTAPGPQTTTRAFLFADLRGYSAFTERRGDSAARELLRRYRRLVRDEIERHGGAEIRTEGDSFYVVFGSVAEAVLTGLAISEAADAASADLPSDPIAVGIGIHAGETVDDEDEGIVSSAVNIAARVCAAAEPGAVLVTDTVRALTRTALDVEFVSQGRRRLKGITEPVALYRARREPTGIARRGGRVAAAIAVVAFAIVAGLVLAIMTTLGFAGSPTSTESASLEVASSPDETHDLGRFFDDEFPTSAEQALLERLLADVAARCERADSADVPVFYMQESDSGERPPFEFLFRVGLTCLTDATRVLYWQGSDSWSLRATASSLFFDGASRLSLPEGDCAEESRVHGTWQSGLHSGQVMCYVADGNAVIAWTFDDANIYAIARRRGIAEAGALYEWWSTTGVQLGK